MRRDAQATLATGPGVRGGEIAAVVSATARLRADQAPRADEKFSGLTHLNILTVALPRQAGAAQRFLPRPLTHVAASIGTREDNPFSPGESAPALPPENSSTEI